MYSSADILKAIERGDIIIEPFNLDQLNTNSYDIRLGNTFYEVCWNKNGPYFVGSLVYLDGEEVEIPVGGTLLGVTKEIVGTNGKVVAELRSRSTTRRISITTNCDAGLGDIGYCDFWTMEFTAFIEKGLIFSVIEYLYHHANIGNWLTKLYEKLKKEQPKPYLVVGEKVAQMVFYECDSEPIETYSGQYTSDWPLNMIPRAYRDRIIRPQN